MDRNELLREQIRENKEPQTILVGTWYPKLSTIPSILKNNFHLISSDLFIYLFIDTLFEVDIYNIHCLKLTRYA